MAFTDLAHKTINVHKWSTKHLMTLIEQSMTTCT